MLKTNSRQARENIRAYIMHNTNATTYDPATDTEQELELKGFANHARYIWSVFCDEMMHDKHQRAYNLRIHKTLSNCFIDWLRGLPNALDVSGVLLGYETAKNTLSEILEETPEERDRFDEMQAENLLLTLIAREVMNSAM